MLFPIAVFCFSGTSTTHVDFFWELKRANRAKEIICAKFKNELPKN